VWVGTHTVAIHTDVANTSTGHTGDFDFHDQVKARRQEEDGEMLEKAVESCLFYGMRNVECSSNAEVAKGKSSKDYRGIERITKLN